MEINDYGTRGSLNNISIRGVNYQQVLVLLDGRRMNSASAGGFDMSDLPVLISEIERIEIVTRSVLGFVRRGCGWRRGEHHHKKSDSS